MGLKNLGRVGTHIFLFFFFWKKYNFMHFKRHFAFQNAFNYIFSRKPVKRPFSKRQKIGFQDQLLFNVGQKNCSLLTLEGSTLQYFLPSLSYHLSLRSLFPLFLSGHFTQVSLYVIIFNLMLYLFYKDSKHPMGY